jgi:DNA (cytosine-5)-methyltransferase 1
MKAIDLFAGIGGWDLGAKEAGIDYTLGIELDNQVCQTRKANNLPTLRAEITLLNPKDYNEYDINFAGPPCQGFTQLGKRKGRLDKEYVYQYVEDFSRGRDTKNNIFPELNDKRSLLVAEPLKWALANRPKHIAWEQVPYVEEFWNHFKTYLEAVGYNVWVGNLNAECYGVPQTRKRAILIASTEKKVNEPEKTHQYYVKSEVKRGDLGVLPWVAVEDVLPELKGCYYKAGYRENSVTRDSDKPSLTMAFGYDYNNHKWIYPDGTEQKINSEQGLVLQSFPREFKLIGSKHSKYTQIGNAIPPKLAYAIIKELIND